MSGVYFNPGELEIMQGLSPAAFKAYVFLRSRMDWRTGLVGRVTKISHWAVGEHHEYSIPKGRGVQVVKLADTTAKIKDAARRLIEELERVGLLINQACAVLTFLCPMASIAPARKNQTGRVQAAQLPTERATPSRFDKPSNDAGFDDVCWPEQVELAAPEFDHDGPNWPYIVDLGSTPPQSSSPDCTGVDAAAGFDEARRGVNRDRATPSQAGSLGRPGKTGGDPYRDRPAASHPAASRRLADVASLPEGTPDGLRNGETNEGLAEGDVAAAPESPGSIRMQALHQVLRSELIIVPNPGPMVAEWVAVEVTDAELREAIGKARAQRAKDDSLQPIPLAYLATIIKAERSALRRAAARVQAAEEKARAAPKEMDVEAVARSLGMWPSRLGEDWGPFRARVLAAMAARGAGDGQA